MATISKKDEPKGEKSYQFISSQSPMKNADPGTDEGAKAIQARVDALAQVFIETVARNRGVDTETALNNFGKGGIFVGKEAVKAGLADAVGSFESVLAEMAGGKRSQRIGVNRKQGTSMSETTTETAAAPAAPATAAAPAAPAPAPAPAVDVAAEIAKAQAAERTRIAGLQTIASAHGVDAATLSAAIGDGTDVASFSLKVATAHAEKNKTRVEALAADEAHVDGVRTTGAQPVEGAASVDSLAAEIAAFAPADRRAAS
jgi:ClpP class serine protease